MQLSQSTYLVKVAAQQLVVALWHRLVQSGLHVFELQHAVLQPGLAALPVLTRTTTELSDFVERPALINYGRLD